MASRIPSAASRIALTSRTVYVGNRSVMAAYTSIQRIMNRSGLIQKIRQRRYYEKPTKKRERLEYEKCHRLYNREMSRKVNFVMKQHDPLPPIY